MTDEEYVRANWNIVHRCDGSYREYRRYTVLLQDIHGHWLDFSNWAAAAEFTRERKEEIRQLEDQIAAVTHEFKKASVCGVGMGPLNGKALVWSHILVRLESALADLKRGMKEPNSDA